MIYAATFGVMLVIWSLLFSQTADLVRTFGSGGAHTIALLLVLVGWALSGGGLGLVVNAAMRRDVPHRHAKLGIGLTAASMLCGMALLGMFFSARPSWSSAQADWASKDGRTQVRGQQQLIFLMYKHVRHREPGNYTLYSAERTLWSAVRPEHMASLSADQKKLVEDYAKTRATLCSPGATSPHRAMQVFEGGAVARFDCTRELKDMTTLLADPKPIHDAYLAMLADKLGKATASHQVINDAFEWSVHAPKEIQADRPITDAIDREIKKLSAPGATTLTRLKGLDELLTTLSKRPTLTERAPSLKSRVATLTTERDALQKLPGVGQSLDFAAYKLSKSHPRRVNVRGDLVAFFDEKFVNAPVIVRLTPDAKDTTTSVPASSRTVAGVLTAPSLEAKITKIGQGMPIALQTVAGTTTSAAGKEIILGATKHPDTGNISAKTNTGWATAGDFPLDEQVSALSWLADYAGVDGHLDAKITKDLQAKGYTGTRLNTWRANNRTYAREHYANHGFYNGVVTGYVLRTATTPTYRSSTSYRSSPSTYRSSSSSYRSSSPSYRSSSSSSYRSSSSSYTSRYSSSSRSASRSGGYRSGK